MCVYICIKLYIHIYTYIHIYIYIFTYIYILAGNPAYGRNFPASSYGKLHMLRIVDPSLTLPAECYDFTHNYKGFDHVSSSFFLSALFDP